jgi:hypothetical protein
MIIIIINTRFPLRLQCCGRGEPLSSTYCGSMLPWQLNINMLKRCGPAIRARHLAKRAAKRPDLTRAEPARPLAAGGGMGSFFGRSPARSAPACYVRARIILVLRENVSGETFLPWGKFNAIFPQLNLEL